MNREIIVGFVKEHEEICLHRSLSQELKQGDGHGNRAGQPVMSMISFFQKGCNPERSILCTTL